MYRDHADRVAVVDEDGSAPRYGELEERARRAANWFAVQGVSPGDRVVLVMRNRSEFVQLEHAFALGGFVRTALGPRLRDVEVRTIVEDARPSCLVVDEFWAEAASDEFFRELSVPVVFVGFGPSDSLPRTGADVHRFEALLSSAPATDAELPVIRPADLCYLLYTSGSTGKPKGVIHTHSSILANIRNTRWALGDIDDSDRAVHTAPLAHMSGTIAMAVATAGGANSLLAKFDPDQVLDMVEHRGATIVPVVPTQLNALVERLSERPRDLRGLKRVAYAGSAITADRLADAKKFFDGKLVQLYGLSEAPMPVTALAAEDHIDRLNRAGLARSAAAGRPAPGVRVRIVDADGGALPCGERGEILVDGPTNCAGYWRNDQATNELFETGGWIRTGDIGIIDDDGYLFIVDRRKDMIVSGGFNVYPREVENALATMEGIAQVAVVSAPDSMWGEAVVAVIVPRPGVVLTLEQVQDHARERLAGYKIPRRLEIREELPTGSTGKVLKRVLADEFWSGAARRVGGG
ncbi:class I adenylate-forming enzyme family protein [Nocardia sp. NPDC004068]|uniref:class I adenylate-forming enzyme family protein n=1 Tax=Nocardia sp. NPDC004068 TaxID=3364303 RepID=UPI0036CA27F3